MQMPTEGAAACWMMLLSAYIDKHAASGVIMARQTAQSRMPVFIYMTPTRDATNMGPCTNEECVE
jgi:hypothetical protein